MDCLVSLEYIDRGFKEIENSGDIDISILKHISEFSKRDLKDTHNHLLQSSERVFLLNQLETTIDNIKNSYGKNKQVFDAFNPGERLRKFLRFSDDILQNKINKATSLGKEYRDLDKEYERRSYNNDIPENHLQNLEKEVLTAQKAYKKQVDIKDQAYKSNQQKLDELEFILTVDFKFFIEKLDDLKLLVSKMQNSIPTEDRAFKDSNAVFIAFNIFVNLNLLKDVSVENFILEIDTIKRKIDNTFLIKQPKTDMYIMYSIHKLKDFVIVGKKDIWEEKMIQHFGFKRETYEKKRKVGNENKKDLHLKIDKEFNRYYNNFIL
tara:strand:+ start:2006 stop:2971 length:966 start_codon:yes stop_codon:yes gene_type:complete